MKIRIIKNSDEFLSLKFAWEQLFKSGNYTPFQAFEFNYYSWYIDLSKNPQNKLAIVVVQEEGHTFSIFPFYIDGANKLRFINDIHADFCDCISSGFVNLQKIFHHVRKELFFSSIRLINIKGDAKIQQYFKNKKLANSLCFPFEKYALFELEKGDFPNNYSQLKSKQKTEFRRIEKKNIDKCHSIFSSDNRVFPKREIISLKEKMINLGYRKECFLTKEQLILIEKLYNTKHILLSVVNNDDQINAVSFVLKKQDEYLFWIDMFDDSKMINLFNYISFMQEISAENRVFMNLGRGVYSYKLANFKPRVEQLYTFLVFENKIQLYFSQFSDKFMSFAKLIYKKIIK